MSNSGTNTYPTEVYIPKFNEKSSVPFPKLVDFNRGLFSFLDAFIEKFSVILKINVASCARYCRTVGYEATQTGRY